jgi:aspartyl-tRNA(Asn)/glutamyl-tRNA(Gln) amidotransferase subunit A
MARSVRDLAMVLDCVQGRDIMDSTSVESESIDMGQLEGTSVKGLRVGIPQEFLCEGMSEEVVDNWSMVARLLEEGGAEVEPVSLPHTDLAIPCYSVLNPCEVASNMARYDGLQFGLRGEAITSTEDMYAESRARGFNEVVRGRILAGNYFLLKKHYQEYYLQALKVRRMVTQDYLSAWSKVDLLLTPVTLTTAPTFSNFTQRDNRSQTATQDFCTQPINLAGVPALTLPSSLSSNNLPISIQLVAPLNQDPMLLRVGAWLEDRLDFPKLVIDEELEKKTY